MGERILVVDDEPTIRSVISQVLTDDGHEIVEACSGEEALEQYRQEPFALVLTDIIMGKMSGLDLLDELRLLDEDSLVVIMTSQASLETATSALRSGAYDFLVKPFDDLNMISAVVDRALDKLELHRRNNSLMSSLKDNMQELEKVNTNLRELANHDGLTGLLNHRSFREALQNEMDRSRRHGHSFSLVFMDVDHFKQYNDTHGHLAGDELLKQLGGILQAHSRSITILARYGGEEFVAMTPETNKKGARRYAERIREKVESFKFPGQETQPLGAVTVSLGVATFPEDGTDSRALIDAADRALYEAKAKGRNCMVSVEDSCLV